MIIFALLLSKDLEVAFLSYLCVLFWGNLLDLSPK